MAAADLILTEQDEARLGGLLQMLCEDAKGRAAFLVDRYGRVLAAAGETVGVDATSLAALTAGSLAAASSLSHLVGENAVRSLHHEGEKEDLFISVVAEEAILVLHFNRRSSLGLVRLRVKNASRQIASALTEIAERDSSQDRAALQEELSRITDADIDNLFAY